MVKYPYFEILRENKMNTSLPEGELFEKQKIKGKNVLVHGVWNIMF